MNSAIISLTHKVKDQLGVLDSNQDWHDALLLSNLYEVDSIQQTKTHYNVTVLSDEIPNGAEGMKMSYRRVKDGTIHLEKITFIYPVERKSKQK